MGIYTANKEDRLLNKKEGLKHTFERVKGEDVYAKFKEENKEDCKKYKLTKTLFNAILNNYYQQVSKLIIEEYFTFKLPFRLGYLAIKAFKIKLEVIEGKLNKKRLIPDYAATRKWYMKNFPIECPTYYAAMLYIRKLKKECRGNEIKMIYHYNDKTDNFAYRWIWNKGTIGISNMSVYKFLPVRSNKTAIANFVKKNDYIVHYYTDLKNS